MKTEIIYSDQEYRKALNFVQGLYNFPITANQNGKKMILPFGTRDHLTVIDTETETKILGENSGLDYASLSLIDWSEETIENAYCDNVTEHYPNFFDDLETDQQLSIMSNYLPY